MPPRGAGIIPNNTTAIAVRYGYNRFFNDGTNYAGQDSLRGRKRRFEQGLKLVYQHLPAGARMLQAVAQRRLDAAIVWGPQAGWFARRRTAPRPCLRCPR